MTFEEVPAPQDPLSPREIAGVIKMLSYLPPGGEWPPQAPASRLWINRSGTFVIQANDYPELLAICLRNNIRGRRAQWHALWDEETVWVTDASGCRTPRRAGDLKDGQSGVLNLISGEDGELKEL